MTYLSCINEVNMAVVDLVGLDKSVLSQLDGQRVARRNGYHLICKGCYGPVHLVLNHHGRAFFQHNPGRAERCILEELQRRNHGGRSEAHIAAQFALTTSFRSMKHWSATDELYHTLDGDLVYVDVAADYDGEPRHIGQGRYAWEVQISSQTLGEFEARTENIRRISDRRPAWLTQQSSRVNGLMAMICDDDAKFVTDRVYLDQALETPAPPVPVGKMIKAVHRHHPEYQWMRHGSDGPWVFIDRDAWGKSTAPTSSKGSRPPAAAEPFTDEPCRREPLREISERPGLTPAINWPQRCEICNKSVGPRGPWGFSFDPAMCFECFDKRQRAS